MTAVLTATPSLVRVGTEVAFNGTGFAASTGVVLSMDNMEDWTAEIVSNVSGAWGSTDVADPAQGTLTVTGNAVAAETIVIGNKTYTWRASVGATANEVLVGANAAASLQNLMNAINGGAGSGTTYGSATVAHTQVTATADATHLYLTAITGGTAGNSLTSTEAMTNASFGAATLAGGTASTGVESVVWTPSRVGTYNVTADDGTNTATLQIEVWSE